MALSVVAVLLSGSVVYGGTDPHRRRPTTDDDHGRSPASAGGIPGPATVSGTVVPTRGTAVQLTPTIPPPATTTTTTTIPPPSDELPGQLG